MIAIEKHNKIPNFDFSNIHYENVEKPIIRHLWIDRILLKCPLNDTKHT